MSAETFQTPHMHRGLRVAFDVNTFLTFMAFVLLVLKPSLLPEAVGWHVDSTGYFNGYMLGAAEWGLATMTLLGSGAPASSRADAGLPQAPPLARRRGVLGSAVAWHPRPSG
jgi:hypothetical protein